MKSEDFVVGEGWGSFSYCTCISFEIRRLRAGGHKKQYELFLSQ